MTSENNISIAILEDDKLVANLLKDFLHAQEGFQVDFIAHGFQEFTNKLTSEKTPDVILLDLKLKDGESGEDLLRYGNKIDLTSKKIIISSHYQAIYLGYMFKLGAHAFLPKEIEKDELVSIIKKVVKNGHYFNEEQFEVLKSQLQPSTPKVPLGNLHDLTTREVEILKLLCYQLTAKEIAEQLFISKKTVETHKSNLLQKTGAKNLAGLIIYSAQNKLINPTDIPL